MEKKQIPSGPNYVWKKVQDLRVSPFSIIDGIYYVGNRDVSSYLVRTANGLILIDTGFASTVPLLLDSISQLGFEPKDIKIVTNTHAHVDHTGGNQRIVQMTGAKVYVHEKDADIVERGTPLTCAYYFYGITKFDTFKVDRRLRDNDSIALDDKEIKVFHTPGHTPGGCSFQMEADYRTQTLNLFLLGAPGQWTFEKENRSMGYQGDIEDYNQTLARLDSLRVDVPLGAHPDQDNLLEKAKQAGYQKNNPFIDPEGWRQKLSNLKQSFEKYLR